VSELTEPIVREPELIVTEGAVHIELLLRSHAYLQFVLGARVSHDLPVVDAIGEGPVGDQRAEVVVGLVEEGVAAILRKLDLLRGVVRVPRKVMEGVGAAQETAHEEGLLEVLQFFAILIFFELLIVFIDLC
jgi:hypothetical protein